MTSQETADAAPGCARCWASSERPKLMASGEITQRLGVSRQRVQQLTQRDDFPAPYAELSLGRIWLASDVELWIQQHWRPRSTRQ
ncbi:hypothetical protein GCM10023107_81910 [Actinoplanes octamycinicus]